MSGRTVSRLVALALILVAGLAYISFDALQITTRTFPVELRLPATGGLFKYGYVTLRGVDVGRVTSIEVQRRDVVVHLAIDSGTEIPVHSRVAVRELSAVGEQYVDFTSDTSQGPYLHSHSTISASPSALPVTVSSLLHDGNALADSLSTPQISTLLDTLTNALAGTGPQLRTLLDSSEALASDLAQGAPGTDDVINYGQVLLRTGIATNPDVTSASGDLAAVSQQLVDSDRQLRAILSEGPGATTAVAAVLAQDQPSIQSLLQSSTTVAGTADADQPGTQALLATMPASLQALIGPATAQGIRVVFNFNDQNDICSYPGASMQVPTDTQLAPLVLGRSCTTTAPDLEQRGAANAPEP